MSTPDTEPRGLRASIEALAGERLRVHGPHVECNNKGCRDRHLSGLHCGDPCEEAHEDCGDWRAWSQVRALLDETAAEPQPEPTPNIADTCCGKCPGGTCYVDQVTGA